MEEDTHLCLTCHMTIIGLDNYVTHKKSLCTAAKNPQPNPSTTLQASPSETVFTCLPSTADVPTNARTTLTSSCGYMTSESLALGSNSVENHESASPSDPLHQYPSISDFLSSLELQIRNSDAHSIKDDNAATARPPELSPKSPYNLGSFDHSKSLKLSNFLNDLDFSSDSDGFIPSDTDDLLDFADTGAVGNQVEGKLRAIPQLHSPGKLKPSSKLAAYRHQYRDTTSQHTRSATSKRTVPIAGKWRPGERKKEEGRRKTETYEKSPSILGENEDEFELSSKPQNEANSPPVNVNHTDVLGTCEIEVGAEEIVTNVQPRKEIETETVINEKVTQVQHAFDSQESTCKSCNKAFATKKSFERHLKSELHKRWTANRSSKDETAETEKENQPKTVNYNCLSCHRSFNNKNNFIRHLISVYHSRRAKGKATDWLSEDLQLLLLRVKPFQCRICSFFCNDSESLLNHCESESHLSMIEDLLGPVKCNVCKVKCMNTANLLEHLKSSEHLSQVKSSDRPCVLRESRTNFKCQFCHVVKHSASAYKAHLKLHEKKYYVPKKVGVRNAKACEHCGSKFYNSFNLRLHIRRRHTNERPFKCKECRVGFADNASLRLHYHSRHHMKQAMSLCDTRSKLPSSLSLKPQVRKYKCGWCSFVVNDHKLLRPHYISEHAKKMFSCDLCGVMFKHKTQLSRHLSSRRHKAKEIEAKTRGDTELKCPECNQCFFSQQLYEFHILTHKTSDYRKELNGVKEGVDSKYHEFLDGIFADSPENKSTERVSCPECKKDLQKSSLVPHLRQHAGCAPFKCVYCDKSFSLGSVLHRHIKAHLNIKKYRCKYCPQEFSQSMLLTNHLFKKHREAARIEPAFRCEDCKQDFVSKAAFTAHRRRMHAANKKQYHCTFDSCNAKFHFASQLTIHSRKHNGERPYLCDQCGYAGQTRNQLTRHHRTHTGERNYHCEYCTYQAASSSNLRRHMRIHTGVKPFQCPYCTYSCNAQENIRKHIINTKKHQGKSIYPCGKCNFEFGTNSAIEFRHHMIDKHGIHQEGSDLSTVLAGIYRKDQDLDQVPEGSQALPVRNKCQEKTGKTLEVSDHAYTTIENQPVVLEPTENAMTISGEMEMKIPWSNLLILDQSHVVLPTV